MAPQDHSRLPFRTLGTSDVLLLTNLFFIPTRATVPTGRYVSAVVVQFASLFFIPTRVAVPTGKYVSAVVVHFA
jgi:hypothetical protein